jgi:NAD-dependent DNA ligase
VARGDAAAHAARLAAGEFITAATPKLQLMDVPSLGWDSAAAIAAVLTAREAELLELAAEFQFAAPAASTGDGPLVGQMIVFTGKLERALRSAAQKRAVALGATAGDGVTDATTILVVGGDELASPTPSSKLKKAQKLAASGHPIQILSETAYYEQFPEAAP